jgi:hypothetical protein
VLRALQKKRRQSTSSVAATTRFFDPDQPDDATLGFYRPKPLSTAHADIPSLESQLDEFWGSAKFRLQEGFHPHLAPPFVELALLRRLGPFPLSGDGPEVYEQLAAVYRRVSAAALELAYAADPTHISDVETPYFASLQGQFSGVNDK